MIDPPRLTEDAEITAVGFQPFSLVQENDFVNIAGLFRRLPPKAALDTANDGTGAMGRI